MVQIDTEGMTVFRTAFDSNTDYASFVYDYKSVFSNDDKGIDAITHTFVPQIFTKAYTQAWDNPGKPVCIVIEEINRGNCAPIFAELSQTFDRDANGFSEYETDANTDLAPYLTEFFSANPTAANRLSQQLIKHGCLANAYTKIILPDNLYIYATMNTSDQLLFPMNSAFKRRWDWEYVPIDYYEANSFIIELAHLSYPWGSFLEMANKSIVESTDNETKQLGHRFVNPHDGVISLEMFKSKVMYYLWSEIYMHEKNREKNIFVYEADPDNTVIEPFIFSDLCAIDCDGVSRDLDILHSFMKLLKVRHLPVAHYHSQ